MSYAGSGVVSVQDVSGFSGLSKNDAIISAPHGGSAYTPCAAPGTTATMDCERSFAM